VTVFRDDLSISPWFPWNQSEDITYDFTSRWQQQTAMGCVLQEAIVMATTVRKKFT